MFEQIRTARPSSRRTWIVVSFLKTQSSLTSWGYILSSLSAEPWPFASALPRGQAEGFTGQLATAIPET